MKRIGTTRRLGSLQSQRIFLSRVTDHMCHLEPPTVFDMKNVTSLSSDGVAENPNFTSKFANVVPVAKPKSKSVN